MYKILPLFLLFSNIYALTVDDNSLRQSYLDYDSLYKASKENDTVVYLHALTTFNGKESINILSNIEDNSPLSLDKKKYIADYYFSLGSYITSSKLYREYLEISLEKEIVISLLTTDIVSGKFESFDSDFEKYKDILTDRYKTYFTALKYHKMDKNSESIKLFDDLNIEDVYGDNFLLMIKMFSLKLEVLTALNKTTDGARLAKFLVDNYQNIPEVSRWLDLYPSLEKMVIDKSTKLESSAKKEEKSSSTSSSNVLYGYQFGSFSEEANAQLLKQVLESKYKSKGMSIYVRKQNRSNSVIYVVTSHAFQTEKSARDYYEKNYKNFLDDKVFFVKIFK